MDAELARLMESGVNALGGLMATDAYTQLRPRLARILRRGGGADGGVTELDRLRAGLMDAVARGDENVRRARSSGCAGTGRRGTTTG